MEYGFHLRKNGYRESSIDRSVRILRRLSKHCDLADVEGVKAYLATLEWSLGTKEIASNVLNGFYKLQGVPFSKPRYRRVDKLPFLQNEGEIDLLIGGCSRRVGSFLQFLKWTGARVIRGSPSYRESRVVGQATGTVLEETDDYVMFDICNGCRLKNSCH